MLSKASLGIDGQTWKAYEQDLEGNLVDLARRLTQELEGAGVSVQGVDDLPAVTAALRGLAEYFAPASAPGIHCDVRMWACAIQPLEALALWQRLDDDVVFRFRGLALPALVIKLRKRDAERVARQLAAVDELVLLPHVEGWGVHGIASGEPLGMLVMLRSEQAAAELLRSGEAVLCVSAGGARRPRVRSQDLLSVRVVAMRDGGEGAQS